jgi:hypothetical protein
MQITDRVMRRAAERSNKVAAGALILAAVVPIYFFLGTILLEWLQWVVVAAVPDPGHLLRASTLLILTPVCYAALTWLGRPYEETSDA